MIVRRVEPRDLEAVVALGKEIHDSGPRAYLAFDAKGARELVAKCAVGVTLCAFVAEREGAIVGVVLGSEQRWPYLEGRFATDIALFARYPGAGRRLLGRLVEWGRERGVDEVLCSVSYGGKSARSAQALYMRQGFEFRGGMFAKTLRT